MIVKELAERSEHRPFPQPHEEIDNGVKEALEAKKPGAKFDDVALTALKKKRNTTKMAGDLFVDSSCLEPLALFTQIK